MNNKIHLIDNWKEHDFMQRNKLWLSYHGYKEKFFKFLTGPEFEFIEFSYKFRPFKKYNHRGPSSEYQGDLKALMESFK